MILWFIKQLLSLKKILSGRAAPAELAWGLAMGVAIGLVPKGNLVAVALICLLIMLRVNHGMAALAAVGCSFLAGKLDPWTHQLGAHILQSADLRPGLERLWNLPLAPWTDLNNTVVLGSTVIALGSVVPIALLSLPIFRLLAPHKSASCENLEPPPQVASVQERPQVTQPLVVGEGLHLFSEVDTGPTHETPTEIETQIDIIRLKSIDERIESADVGDVTNQRSMNEALGYLMRRLKDSRREKAA